MRINIRTTFKFISVDRASIIVLSQSTSKAALNAKRKKVHWINEMKENAQAKLNVLNRCVDACIVSICVDMNVIYNHLLSSIAFCSKASNTFQFHSFAIYTFRCTYLHKLFIIECISFQYLYFQCAFECFCWVTR